MKKKVVLALIPLFLIILSVGGFLLWQRERTTVIEIGNWNKQGDQFFLCDIKVVNFADKTDYIFLYRKMKKLF